MEGKKKKTKGMHKKREEQQIKHQDFLTAQVQEPEGTFAWAMIVRVCRAGKEQVAKKTRQFAEEDGENGVMDGRMDRWERCRRPLFFFGKMTL